MLNLNEPIFSIKALSDGTIAVIDQSSTFRKINPQNFKILGGFKSKLYHSQKIFTLVDTSKSGRYCVLAIPKKGMAALYLSEEKKLIDTIGNHQGEIEAVAISDNELYAATGGTDGKSYIYYASSGSLLFSLPPHRDYVSAIAFSPSTHYVATGSFDQTILVKNIVTMSDHFRLIGHNSVIKKLLFLSNDELLSADKEGQLIIWGIKSKRIQKRLPKLQDEITDLAISEDKNFLFVSTKKGNIALYNLSLHTQLSAKYIQDIVSINALAVINTLLVYGTDSGEVKSYSLHNDEEQLKAYIENNDFAHAYLLVAQNTLLAYSQPYIELEKKWESIYSEARESLIEGKREVAQWMLSPFSKVASKQTKIKHLLEDFVDFKKFKLYIQDQKYSLAYALASNYPVYKETKEYAELESIWEATLSKAKKLLMDEHGQEKARNILVNFRTVPSKSKLINELFEQSKVYVFFRKKLVKRDFESIFKLVKNYPFLTHYQEYKDMLTWGDHVFIKIHQLLDQSDFIEAAKLAQGIKDFPDFKNDVASLIEEPQLYVNFEKALTTNNIEKVYHYLSEYPFLAELSAVMEFEKGWDTLEKEALALASTGEVLGVLDTLEAYLMIDYKRIMIATIVKSGMIKKIKLAMEKGLESKRLEKLLELFVNFFGSDPTVRALVNKYSFDKGVSINCDAFVQGTIEKIDFIRFKESYLAWK